MNSNRIAVSLDHAGYGDPRWVSLPAACATRDGIQFLCGDYYTYLPTSEVLAIPGCRKLSRRPAGVAIPITIVSEVR